MEYAPSMCWKIKRNTQSLLSGFQVVSVKLVAFFHCAEARVLWNIKNIIRDTHLTDTVHVLSEVIQYIKKYNQLQYLGSAKIG
jgi:hypothetical protein